MAYSRWSTAPDVVTLTMVQSLLGEVRLAPEEKFAQRVRPGDEDGEGSKQPEESPAAADAPIAASPVSAQCLSAQCPSALPLSTLPLSTLPLSTLPLSTLPLSTLPLSTLPQPAESVVSVEPAVAEPERPCSLAQLERDHIRWTLEYTQYNQSAAARLLDINRTTLIRKLKQHGIEVSSRRAKPGE